MSEAHQHFYYRYAHLSPTSHVQRERSPADRGALGEQLQELFALPAAFLGSVAGPRGILAALAAIEAENRAFMIVQLAAMPCAPRKNCRLLMYTPVLTKQWIATKTVFVSVSISRAYLI